MKRYAGIAALVVLSLATDCRSEQVLPVIRSATLLPAPNKSTPQVAVLELKASRPVRVRLRIGDGKRKWEVSPTSAYASEHSLPILGLRPDRTHAITAEVIDRAGNVAESQTFEVKTPPLPEGFPEIRATVSQPEKMEDGVTLFNLIRWPESGSDRDYGVLLAVDSAGEVIWYYVADHDTNDARRLANGNILYMYGRAGGVVEIDMLGNVVQQWHSTGTPKEAPKGSTPVATDTFHHEVFELPSGNLLTLSSEIRVLDNYPSSDTDPEAAPAGANVVGDIILEFTRDGRVVREWKLLDIMDPYRIGYSSLSGGFWKDAYAKVVDGNVRDWAHTNAIFHDATGNALIISQKHQDAVFKLDLNTGVPVWILGNPGDWKEPWQRLLLKPKGHVEWPFRQHAPMLTPHGTVLMFDNGAYRARPFQEKQPLSESYSRAVEFAVDEQRMEVSQVWSYGGGDDEQFFSSFLCDADWMPQTGNVLITDGGRITDDAGNPAGRPGKFRWGRIVEVTHTTPAEKVFELVVRDHPPAGWHIYRAERLSGLYSSGAIVQPSLSP